MDDPEMAKIRAQRMSQMQANQGGSRADAEQQKQAAEQQELMKTSILKQASPRSASTRSFEQPGGRPTGSGSCRREPRHPDGCTGQIAEKLDDAALRGLLEKVSAQQQKTTTVKFDRRRAALDSDDED